MTARTAHSDKVGLWRGIFLAPFIVALATGMVIGFILAPFIFGLELGLMASKEIWEWPGDVDDGADT